MIAILNRGVKVADLFSVEPATEGQLIQQLQAYNHDEFRGEDGQQRRIDREIQIELILRKAKKENRLNRDQAFKLMAEHIRRADYRGFITADRIDENGENSYIRGIINRVWPAGEPMAGPSPPAAPSPTPPGQGDH